MSVEETLARLVEGAKCSICLDDLKDPVTIECGHNFCRSCIQHSWEDFQEMFPCPVCRHQCEEGYFRSNTQLGRVTEIARRLSSSVSKRKRKRQEVATMCDKHNQVLSSFCKKEMEALCDQCTRSPSHRGHSVMSLKDAATHYRSKLQGYMRSVKKQIAEAQEEISKLRKKPLELKAKMAQKRQEVATELQNLTQFLERERQAALSRLDEEEKDVERKFSENITAFSNYSASIRSLLSRVEEQRSMSEVELLSQVKRFYEEADSQVSPPVFTADLRRENYLFPPQYSELRKLIKIFKADVTLDPETAHRNLIVSEDNMCVRFAKKKQSVPERRTRSVVSPVVLGLPTIQARRHFWEVQVGNKPEWAVGVCAASLPRSSSGPSASEGCWRILLRGDAYEAPGARPPCPPLEVRARVIGVFLDYELGQLSFYDMPEKSLICTFTDTFTGPLRPYFSVGPGSEPLRICRGTDDD